MSITVDPADRAKGIVYLDPAKADVPATHVMILGVGRFLSPTVPTVTSPPASALAMAEWFLGKDGFHNHERPLGSVAMAISAEPNDAPTQYRGATIPRAKFAVVEEVVGEWVNRINSHKDNLAFLYVCSHGESSGSKTGFLLEEYGTKPTNRTVGLSEVEQFARALRNAKPVRQVLIFDCCRNKTSFNLPFEEEFGAKLISLSKPEDDHNETRQQWIFAATALNEKSTGRKNKTTIFADSLLRSLGGAAADPRGDDWRVTPGGLVETVPWFLGLHKRSQEPLQTPNGVFANPFSICFASEPKAVQTFVALVEGSDWKDCELSIMAGKKEVFRSAGMAQPDGFAVAALPEAKTLDIVAKTLAGSHIGRKQRKVRPPAAFVILGDEGPSAAPAAKVTRSIRGGGGGSATAAGDALETVRPTRDPAAKGRGDDKHEITINAQGPMGVANAAVVTLTRLGETGTPSLEPLLIDLGWPGNSHSRTIKVDPGKYLLSVQTPDGRSETQVIAAHRNSDTDVELPALRSPQEWLTGALAAGLIPNQDVRAKIRGRNVTMTILTAAEVGQRTGWPGKVGFPDYPQDLQLQHEPHRQDRYRGYRVNGTPRPHKPYWVAVGIGADRELAAIGPVDGSLTVVAVDRAASPGTAASIVAVESGQWTPLLGYLARRNFAAAEVFLDSVVDSIREAVFDKMGNPFAAAAGALIAVGSGRFEHFKLDEQWLRNLKDWFEGLPDGAIILARRLASRARTKEERAEALKLFREGFSRGIPLYSLSLEWLDAGLDEFGEESDRAAARVVRKVATRVDPSKPFTTIRLGREGRIP